MGYGFIRGINLNRMVQEWSMGQVIYVKVSLQVDYMEWNNKKWSEVNQTNEEQRAA